MVLIVPLWNWNKDSSNCCLKLEGSNRTFMELKSTSDVEAYLQILSSNRTFMELKFLTMISSIDSEMSSNRTFMELKCPYFQ